VDQQRDEREDGEPDPEAEVNAVVDALAELINIADDVEPGQRLLSAETATRGTRMTKGQEKKMRIRQRTPSRSRSPL
jgi:hypothetical protein